MKIKNIEYYNFKGTKEVFRISLEDNNISRIQFTCKIYGTERMLFETYVSYTNGRHMTYNHTRIPKKYNQMFNEYIKNYPTE